MVLDNKIWQPKEKELFWYVSRTMRVFSARWLNSENKKNNNPHFLMAISFNCFKTKEQAEEAKNEILKTLENLKRKWAT